MEALHGGLTSGGQSRGQKQCEPEPLQTPNLPKQPQQPQQQNNSSKSSHGRPQQPKQSRRQLPERKRLRAQRQSVDSDTNSEHKEKETETVPELSPPPATTPGANTAKSDAQEETPKQKRERKPQKPGKYVCTYCSRACAKPSVLQKHIRSHTGERPYPCPPCGFSFKTKSNLYKHRKSHTHRVKAGLASQGEQRSTEEQVTESEDEARHLSSAASLASLKNQEVNQVKDCTTGHENSYVVRKRLAMRLSRGKDALKDSTDDKKLSLILASKESTESGYFSRSESMEQSQDVNPNTSAKSYAEIILGKYGRLGHLQRMSRHNNSNINQQSMGQDDKTVPFTLPKKQVIDHITKLITINEAVVDTSKIDSVKPRRFSLSRKNSESQKSSAVKEAFLQIPKPTELLYKSSGSITMGVPCEKFQHSSSEQGQTASAPLLRSRSMPTAATSRDAPTRDLNKSRLTQSFDEREPLESQVPRRYGMLRRQPAIDGDPDGSHAFFSDSLSIVPDHKQTQPQPYECESCGTGCKDWEGYKKHRQTMCVVHRPRNEVVVSQMECSQIVTQSARPGMLALRKRRKAESFELEDPTSPTSPTSPVSISSCPSAEQCNFPSNVGFEAPRRQIQTCSVIQHTSSFEKQESLYEYQSSEPAKDCTIPRDQEIPQKHPSELSAKTTSLKKLVRQHNVHSVPEILVTEESNASPDNLPESSSIATKQQQQQQHQQPTTEKCEEFPWRQRGSSLAQLPIEKLPPKKKRLRLAEAAQSSGESSFESISLPLSPGQESSTSFASSRSTSFEESNRFDGAEPMTSTSTMRRSRAPQMLTVPGVHQREMRRSASEQAPHDPQPQNVSLAENRSKSFDYSSLSPERSAIGWRERRKCLLIRHTAVRDPDEEDLPSSPGHSSDKVISNPQTSSVCCSKPSASPSRGETTSKDMSHQCKQQSVQFPQSSEPDPAEEDALKIFPNQLSSSSISSSSMHGLSGAARAHYQPVPTGLKLEIVPGHCHSKVSHCQNAPQIVSSVERVQPNTFPAVVVRLQTDTLTPACAIYTTLSQSMSPRPLEAVDAGPHTEVSTLNHKRSNPHLPVWSEDPRASGSGGNKRMLSPSNSIELSPQQQQKRVKEDEVHDDQELAPEAPSDSPTISPAALQKSGPSYPSMLSSTCNSWCYLNYIKPNPATLDQHKSTSICSVYSSWSTSSYDPNPPGLSSKTALSLLHCKQRLSPSIYTTSNMTTSEEKKEEPTSPQMYIKLSPSDSSGDHQRVYDYSPEQSVGGQLRGRQSGGGQAAGRQARIHTLSLFSSRSKDSGSELTQDCSVVHKDTCLQPVWFQTPVAPNHPCTEVITEQTTLHDQAPAVEPLAPDHQKSSNVPNVDINQTTRLPCATSASKGPDSKIVSDPAPSNALSDTPRSSSTESTQRTSASVRRALFARRRFTPTVAPPTSPPPPKATPTPACSSPRCHVNSSPPRCLLSTVAPPVKAEGRSLGNSPGNPPDPTHAKAPPTAPHPCRSHPAQNLLSHLPLHSQRSEATPTLLIPIGGIHMIQPRPSTKRLLSPKIQQSDSECKLPESRSSLLLQPRTTPLKLNSPH